MDDLVAAVRAIVSAVAGAVLLIYAAMSGQDDSARAVIAGVGLFLLGVIGIGWPRR